MLLAKCPCRPSRTSSHLRLYSPKTTTTTTKKGGGDECYRRNPPGGRSRRGATSNLVCSPKTTPTKGVLVFLLLFFKVLLVKSPWRPIRTRNHLKFSQIAQNNPNTKQTKKPSVTGKIALEADPDEKPPQTPSDRPKQPQQKANKPTTTTKTSITVEIHLEAEPDEEPPQTRSVHPKQPQQKGN